VDLRTVDRDHADHEKGHPPVWVKRFETYLAGQLQPGRALRNVQTFETAGYTVRGSGFVLGFESGASVYVQIVRASPSGGEGHGRPEVIVEGEPPAPVGTPQLEAHGGRVSVADIEHYLAAAVVNGGSREIRKVTCFSEQQRTSQANKYGVTVEFHSGGTNYLLFVHTLSPGRRPSTDAEFTILEAV
jgi:hypothetical protein